MKGREIMPIIHGELDGIRKSFLTRIEDLYEFSVPFGQVVTVELAQKMIEITA